MGRELTVNLAWSTILFGLQFGTEGGLPSGNKVARRFIMGPYFLNSEYPLVV